MIFSHRGHREHGEKIEMEDEKIINSNCWVAWFDILGFRALMSKYEKHLDVFVGTYYEDILRTVNEKAGYWPKYVAPFWISDTFVFYTFNDSIEAFTCLNQVARHFFEQILYKIPLRGALSFGRLYADREKGIYLGPVLIDAYEYAEKQDWVGFVLTPCAVEQFNLNRCYIRKQEQGNESTDWRFI